MSRKPGPLSIEVKSDGTKHSRNLLSQRHAKSRASEAGRLDDQHSGTLVLVQFDLLLPEVLGGENISFF